MVKTGQEIFSLKISPSELQSYQRLDRLNLFIKIALAVILVISTLGTGSQLIVETSNFDFSYVLVAFFAILGYLLVQYLVQQELRKQPDPTEKIGLVIYEYGIEISSELSNSDMDEGKRFYPYNYITDLEINREARLPRIWFKGDGTSYTINFEIFSNTTKDIDERVSLLEKLYRIMERIEDNLSKVENKEHPTIIPRSYFRDILE